MARLVTITVVIFIGVCVVLLSLVDEKTAYVAISLIALSFLLFIYAIYGAASRMQNELTTVNKYLSNLENVDSINYKAHFFTKEFEDINHNLIKVLKSSKKREDVKQRYNAKLKLKNQQRSDMLSAIAHEFRNPIASIMGYSQTLQDDDEIPQALQDRFLAKIYKNGDKIEALLERLILWNKFESGEALLHASSFDIYTLIEENKALLEEKYPQRTIRLKGESYMVKADRTLIDIVLKNLIENALKYSEDEICIGIKEGEVFVEDTGEGISLDNISKVTKKFYRSGTHNWDNSMGLGLSIVKNILSLHGSKLEIESQLNVGSHFSFKI
jgi:signal transduction histidine kinase